MELANSTTLRLQREPPGGLAYSCNVCGTRNACLASEIRRESGGCCSCGATLRYRSLAAALTLRLFRSVILLCDLPVRRDIVGAGMSDAPCYASKLESRFSYTNTYYHCEPFLDISQARPDWEERFDFIVSSDVFEHVVPPIQTAFDNLFRLLKPGGCIVFSVPYSLEPETHEHFPRLHDYSIREEHPGTWLLTNITADGQTEIFRDLVFHGGSGLTLEMRLFSLAALRRHFEAAGFIDLHPHDEEDLVHGIYWAEPWGITLSALKKPS